MRLLTIIALVAALLAPSAGRAESNLNINVNLGAPSPPPPPPREHPSKVIHHQSVVVSPQVVFDSPPLFLTPSRLGFYIGVDIPYDIMLVSGVYYLFQNDQWYRADHYNGPWTVTSYKRLPEPVRRHKMEKIRYYRDHEYDLYRSKRDHYHGKHFRPDKEHKKHWKDEKRRENDKWHNERQDRKRERDEERHEEYHHRR